MLKYIIYLIEVNILIFLEIFLGVPLRQDELYKLISSLDLDGDGEIDYK